MKRFLYILIPFLAILLMSHNTFAVDLTQDVYLVQGNFGFSMAPHSWACYNDSSCPSWSSGVYQRSFASYGANIFDISISIPNRTYTSGDWIVFDFYFFHSNTAANHSIFDGIRYEGTNYIDVVDVKVEQLTDNSAHATVYTRVYNTFTDSNLRFTGNVIMFQLQSAANAQYKAEVDAGVLTIWHERTDANYNNKLDSIVDAIENNSADAALDREQSETQDAADAAQDAADDSSSDASTATSSLISVIGGFVSAVTSAQPTNCRINANLNHIDMGQLDLCANPVPSYIQIIGSIILICAAIPLAIILFNRFIGLFRSFQS